MNRNKNNLFLGWRVIILGLTSISAQILLMRELAVIFYGNELSLGVMLGVWLFWTAAGSALLPVMHDSEGSPLSLNRVQLLLVPLLPAMLWVVRAAKNLFAFTPGEIVGFTPMLVLTLCVLAPLCIVNGRLYTLACRRMHRLRRDGPEAVRHVYRLEAMGAGAGGILAGLLLITVPPAHTLTFLSLLNLAAVLLLDPGGPSGARSSLAGRLLVLIPAALLGCLLAGPYQRTADRILWRGHVRIASRNTVHGNIAVTRTGELTSLYQNGILTATAPDRLSAEESVHFALLEHPRPRTVLFIGGSMGGGVAEARRHPSVERLDVVELDPALFGMAERFFPPGIARSLEDSAVHLHPMDGRRFLKTTERRFDAVLIDLPDPYTAQINRFYTVEFFREVRNHLNPGGVFSFPLSSSENAIGPELADFLGVIDATLGEVFPERIVLPGETARFIASTAPGLLTVEPDSLVRRLRARGIETRYVREYYIPYQVSEERIAYLHGRLRAARKAERNSDFQPVGYYYDTILWSTTFSRAFKSLFLAFAQLTPLHVAAALVFLFLSISFLLRGRGGSGGVLISVFCIGFTEISLQVIILLAFQIIHGYMYALLSIIIAGYMAGLAWGSHAAGRRGERGIALSGVFRRIQLGMALYPLLIASLFFLLHRLSLSVRSDQWTLLFFPLFSAGAGMLGGLQFPLANRLVLRPDRSLARVAGFLYGFDLAGSALGAMIASALFLPVFGIYATLGLLAVLNLGCWLVLLLGKSARGD